MFFRVLMMANEDVRKKNKGGGPIPRLEFGFPRGRVKCCADEGRSNYLDRKLRQVSWMSLVTWCGSARPALVWRSPRLVGFWSFQWVPVDPHGDGENLGTDLSAENAKEPNKNLVKLKL